MEYTKVKGNFLLPGKSQHSADDRCVAVVPEVVTDRPPHPLIVDLHPTLKGRGSIHKSY